jgi:hypothetical protein
MMNPETEFQEGEGSLEDLRRRWSQTRHRLSGEAHNEMVEGGILDGDLDAAVRRGRLMAVLPGRGALRRYLLRGPWTGDGRVHLLCRLTPRRVVVDHVFRAS